MAEKKPAPKPAPAPKDVQSESSKQDQENEAKDRKAKAEYDNYMKGEKTRLKDQGSSFFNFKKGGSVSRPDLQKINKPSARSGKNELFNSGGGVKSASARADGCAIRGKTRA
jgi:hypothetical protein